MDSVRPVIKFWLVNTMPIIVSSLASFFGQGLIVIVNVVVTTFAGSTLGFLDATGTSARFNAPIGVAVDSAGVLYIGDQSNQRIRKITAAAVVSTLAGHAGCGVY